MAVDNPQKYNALGGLHIERLTTEDVKAEGLDPSKDWIMLGIKEGDDVKVAIFSTEHALKIAEAIKSLAELKL